MLLVDPASDMSLADQFAVAGRTLVFCDDTDIAGQPVAKLRPDLRILVAVQMASENYAALDGAMTAALDQYGVAEFHATDIATGNRAWKGRSEEERVAALAFVAEQMSIHAGRIGAVWLPKGQYPKIRKDAEKIGKVGVGFKHGLRRVLVRSVVERLAAGTRPAMLWLDQDSPIAGPKVEHWPEATFLVGGGPIIAPSQMVLGLQLADLAIWSVQRFQVMRAGFDDGTATAIDKVARDVVAGFPTGFDDLRGDAHADWAP
ncbi:hypothetical protein GCM10011349_44170 [Novosphingobium indicum]|uniref:DUF3800 domain-containing protein n=2 Tax=Novosphingobium indicum TaxID=462949 RepID=A0ABQ2K2Z0_9SPHN|nr:hypothetical protein GCM10011349_44170 [Novosphingobium indicum]